ncbi:MAG: hypothetical protein JNL52_01450 [Flavobacteriales bacterium]|nr:hypothetical protein [Flavobacteriales bacterium]
MTGSEETRFNEANVMVLHAVTGITTERLRRVHLRPRSSNALYLPWYAERPGGAFVHGDRITVTDELHRALQERDAARTLRWLLLMAHEVMHVEQAWRTGRNRASKWRFTARTVAGYVSSFLRHGTAAHRMATMEQEAEIGRTRMRELMRRTGGVHPGHQVIDLVLRNDVTGMKGFLDRNDALIRQLRSEFVV